MNTSVLTHAVEDNDSSFDEKANQIKPIKVHSSLELVSAQPAVNASSKESVNKNSSKDSQHQEMEVEELEKESLHPREQSGENVGWRLAAPSTVLPEFQYQGTNEDDK